MFRRLDVYLHNHKAGILEQDNSGVISFTYDGGYLEKDLLPLSLSLPLKIGPYNSSSVRAFFSGLLPDELARHKLAKYLGVSEKNPFSLLEAIGGECAGAISVYPQNEEPSNDTKDEDEILEPDRLYKILDLLKRRPLLAGDDGVRLSLAGAQDKIAVGISGDKIVLVKGNRPTSHILKPLIDGVDDSVHNEIFCMNLASKIGIITAQANIQYVKGTPYFLTKRYDRMHNQGGGITRIHQEDFCQAMGIMPEQKYEREGGPSIANCMNLLEKHSKRPALDQSKLIEIIIYNYLIGNNDAHGKNFSLLYQANKPSLSPAYDLLSTAIYPSLSSKMAMKIGGKYNPDDVYKRHWELLIPSSATAKRNLNKNLNTMSDKVKKLSRELKAELEGRGLHSVVYDKIIRIIDQRSKHVKEFGIN